MTEINHLKNELTALAYFMSLPQYQVTVEGLDAEESNFFIDKICELGDIVLNKLPCPYETEETPSDEKIAYLRYFKGSATYYIIERDAPYCDETEAYKRENINQIQAYSYGSLDGVNYEYGYAPISEMADLGFEIDFYFTPKPMKDIIKNL